jgi:hypothetical protein
MHACCAGAAMRMQLRLGSRGAMAGLTGGCGWAPRGGCGSRGLNGECVRCLALAGPRGRRCTTGGAAWPWQHWWRGSGAHGAGAARARRSGAQSAAPLAQVPCLRVRSKSGLRLRATSLALNPAQLADCVIYGRGYSSVAPAGVPKPAGYALLRRQVQRVAGTARGRCSTWQVQHVAGTARGRYSAWQVQRVAGTARGRCSAWQGGEGHP